MAAFQPALNALRSSGDLCLSAGVAGCDAVAGGAAACCGGLVFGAGATALGGAADVIGCSTGSGFGSCFDAGGAAAAGAAAAGFLRCGLLCRTPGLFRPLARCFP